MQKTEMRNPATRHIDRADTGEILRLIQTENENAAHAVGQCLAEIGQACEAIVRGMEKGGRLFYIGAGTSGRLGVLDAAECPPTYGVTPDTVIGIIAGGRDCMFHAAEREEDNADAGRADLAAYVLKPCDTVVGISASGNASYVVGALQYAQEIGCTTVSVANNPDTRIGSAADIAIVADTDAEVVTGSTRMKAGSAQKMILNMLSTCAMIRTGHVIENMMVNLRPTNDKLTVRVVTILCELTGLSREAAEALLTANEWSIRKAFAAYKEECEKEQTIQKGENHGKENHICT